MPSPAPAVRAAHLGAALARLLLPAPDWPQSVSPVRHLRVAAPPAAPRRAPRRCFQRRTTRRGAAAPATPPGATRHGSSAARHGCRPVSARIKTECVCGRRAAGACRSRPPLVATAAAPSRLHGLRAGQRGGGGRRGPALIYCVRVRGGRAGRPSRLRRAARPPGRPAASGGWRSAAASERKAAADVVLCGTYRKT